MYPVVEQLESRLLLSGQPLISELLADNKAGLKDGDGDYSDWIEINNPATQAVDLSGWSLKDSSSEWTFPNGTTLGPGGFLVVFASGKGAVGHVPAPPAGELHTNFKLSANGEYLGLLDDQGNVVSEYHDFPAQGPDISYGIAQNIETTSLVLSGDMAKYLVPSSGGLGATWTSVAFNDGTWKSGPTGLGYANMVAGFLVHNVKASVNVGDLSTALTVLATPADQSGSWSENRAVFNCDNDGNGAGHYTGAATAEANFPGFTSTQDNFVTEATAYLTIPAAGQWTFGVNSDDGFRLTITGATITGTTNATNAATANGTDTLEFANPRGANDTFGVFSFPAAGTYAIHLVYYENGGGSSAEMFDAAGAQTGFDTTMFHLVGGAGGLAVASLPVGVSGSGDLSSLVATDVKSYVKGVNATMYVRIPFSIADPGALQSLTLKMKYDDGYVAYLNGVEIARKNAPASPAWNSAATAQRTDAQATAWENVDVSQYLYLLHADDGVGAADNVLAIQVLNSSASDGDMLMLPELAQVLYQGMGEHYFAIPTPGEANTDEFWMRVADTKFSQKRGYYDAAFNLVISTATTGAAIYYTLDGSEPSATNGTLYGGPISIRTTATVRARAFKTGYEPTDIDTETYIFPDAVLNQPATPAGFPTSWNGTAADYEMDPDIVNNPLYADQMKAALLALPTVSFVTTVNDMFGPSGIYALSTQQSPNPECATSVEWMNPDGTPGFQIDAGLQIYGGAFRDMGLTRKKSFRAVFQAPYGPTKLDYPIFSDDPSAVTSFDSLIFRAGSNDAWNNWGGPNTQYITDQFMHETQLALGAPSARGRFVNLYVDGLYWGIYEVSERPDAAFSASYFGADKTNWDGLNYNKPIGGSTTAATAWNDLITQVRAGVADLTSFEKIQGNNADGTPNATYTNMLDVDNYIKYMLDNIYGGTGDWPWHNYYLGIQKSPATGFKFYNWDSEGAIVIWSDVNANVLPTLAGSGNTGDIAEPWSALVSSSEFRSEVADYVYQFFFNGGALTAQVCHDRYQALAAEVAPAIVGESARWGDQATATPYTLDTWETTRDYVLNTYMPNRSANVLQQLKDAGFYPTFDPPTMKVNGAAKHGGTFLPGDVVSLTAAAGAIYWTTDGSDPRPLGGGAPNAAQRYTVPLTLQRGTHVKTRVYLNGQWSALSEATFYADLAPSIRITEIMYNPAPPTAGEIAAGFIDNNDFEYVELRNTSTTSTLPLEGLRFSNGIDFTFPAVSLPPGGYVLVVSNEAAFRFRYPAFAGTIAGTYTGSLNNAGEEIRLDAPVGGIIHDFTYKDGWFGQTDGEGFSLTIRDPGQALALWDLSDGWRASAAPGGTPGYADTLLAPGSVIINEVLAHTDPPFVDSIEFRNVSSAPVNISGWFLSDARTDALGNDTLRKYQIPAEPNIPAGGYLVLYADQTFGSTFLLSELGDEVYLSSNAGGVAGGYREHVAFDATPHNLSVGLTTKSTGGTDFTILAYPTLGSANAPAYSDDLAINELSYHPADPTPAEAAAGFINSDDFEFVEIRNNSTTTSHALSDYHLAGGVGFTFGWYGAGGTDANENWTLEQGATATWTTPLPAGQATYEVFARWDTLDNQGWTRSLDGQASYAIQHVGGTSTVLRDQSPDPLVEGADYQDADGWVSLGSYTFDSLGTVVLTRNSGNPDNWTIADQVKFVSTTQTVVASSPVLDSRSTQAGRTVLGPGQYVVLVRNYAAFDMRYGIAAHNIPVAGEYTGQMNNNGDKVQLMLAGTVEPTGFVPYYRVDYVNYGDALPWPVEADGTGASLNRTNPGGYANDPANWRAGAWGGTPGAANIAIDPTAPTVPAGLTTHITITPVVAHLTWLPATDGESFVDHYVVYDGGNFLANVPSGTTTYDDTTITAGVAHSYQVSAVNRDGYESALSTASAATVPAIVQARTPDAWHIEITFTEAMARAVARNLANYSFTGGAIAGADLAAGDATMLVLTTQEQMLMGQSYDLTLSNLATASGNELPASLAVSLVFEARGSGTILREYWQGIGGTAVTDLTGNAAYPNSPTGTSFPTSFEAPADWADSYGTRMRGFVTPPITGQYTFWIASDDNSVLYLSTDKDPANKVQIATVSNWTGSRQFDTAAEQKSAAITLVAGQKYYIEAIQKEGGGGDNLAVRWQLPGGVWENPSDPNTPIPGIRLSPFSTDALAPTVTVARVITHDHTPALRGTIDDPAATVTLTIQGNDYDATNNGDGTWTLADDTISPPLADGDYDIQATAQDATGNVGQDVTLNELTIDNSTPAVTVTALSTADSTPPLSGTVSEAKASIVVTVDGADYQAVNNGNGTWTLANNTIAPLANGTYDIIVTATDGAGNVGHDATSDELNIDHPPEATPQAIATNEDTPLEGQAGAVDGGPLTFRAASQPTHGTLVFHADGSFRYTPAANYFGADSFSFIANDGVADSNTAVVSITVRSVNDVPVATGQTVNLAQDVGADIVLVATDVETPTANLTFTPQNPSHGTLTHVVGARYRYTPQAGYTGPDSFTFTATDALGQVSNSATVTLGVYPQNSTPIVQDQTVQANALGPTLLTLTASDRETPAADLVPKITHPPKTGSLTWLGGIRFRYDPNPSYAGPVTFSYTVTDNGSPPGSQANPGPLTSREVTVTIQAARQDHIEAGEKAVYTDTHGHAVTISLTGKGEGVVYFPAADPCDAGRIILQGTDATSSLTVAVKGTGATTNIYSLSILGGMKSIAAATTSIVTDLTATGLVGSIALGDVTGPKTIEVNTGGGDIGAASKLALSLGVVSDLSLNTHGLPIASLTAVQWVDTDGQADTITAPWIATLTTKGRKGVLTTGLLGLAGDFAASLDLSGAGAPRGVALGTVAIAGQIAGGTWTVHGSGGAGAIASSGTAAAWALRVDGAVASLDARSGLLAGSLQALYFTKLTTKGDLTAAVTATGTDAKGVSLGAFSAGAVHDAQINLPGGVTSLTAVEWKDTDATNDTIHAAWIGAITTKGQKENFVLGLPALAGDFQADLSLSGAGLAAGKPALGSAKVAGGVADSAWDIAGPAGTVTVAGAAHGWTVQAASLTSLVAGDLADASVTVTDALGAVKAVRWTAGTIAANSVGSLTTTGLAANTKLGTPAIAGDFGAELTVRGAGLPATKAAVGSASIAGDLNQSHWTVGGAIGTVTVIGSALASVVRADGSIAALTLGAAIGSDFLAGMADGPTRAAPGGESFQNLQAVIKSIRIVGLKLAKSQAAPRYLANTYFCAAHIGTVSLLNADPASPQPYGLYAHASDGKEIASVTYHDTVSGLQWSWKPGPTAPSVGAMMVQVI